MKIQIVSDLHLEWGTSDRVFCTKDICGDMLVFAGDSHGNAEKLYNYVKFFAKEVPCILVLGNHEYYGTDLKKGLDKYKKWLHKPEENIFLLENETIVFNHIAISGATLWTDFEPLLCRPHDLEDRIADFSLIKKGKEVLTIPDVKSLFVESVKAFTRNMNLHADKKHVVVTHHAPSHKSVFREFIGSFLNPAFVSNLEWFIAKQNPVLWIHGHVHSSHDYTIGNTRVVCNPFGYFMNEENPDFKKDFVIEI